jgi:hypothetical protein
VTGLELPATLVFDHPTPLALAGHILAELAGDDTPDDDEAAVRAVLAGVSLAQLRELGVLDQLLTLAGRPETGPPSLAEDDIDAMDVDALVQAALKEQGAP